MSIKRIKPAYFLGAPNLTNPKVLGSKVDEIIEAINGITHSTGQSITALAGGGQTGATPLIVGFNLVTTETDEDSVILPALADLCGCQDACDDCNCTSGCGCQGGMVIPVVIKNVGPGELTIYPAVGETINGGAANAPITLSPGASISLVEVDCEDWATFNSNDIVTDDTLTGSGTEEDPLSVVPGGGSGFAMFFGTTTGTGSFGNDYAATVAPGAKVPFPRDGAASGIVRVDADDFTLPDIGVYEVTFKVHTTEPGQLQLTLDGTVLANSTSGNMNPTSGGHIIIGNVFVTTTLVNQVLAVINPAGNTPALTITPADGASTHANSQTLTIKRLA